MARSTRPSTTRTKKGQNNFSFNLLHLPEPRLEFGFGQKMEYPRDGLFLYGPAGNVGALPVIRYGVIGTKEGVRRFHQWARQIRSAIPIPKPGPRSRSIEPQHVTFPGFREAFRAEWPEPAATIDDIDPVALDRALHIGNRHEAIHAAVDLYVDRLIAENNRREAPPEFWFVIIPESVYKLGRPLSKLAATEKIQGEVTVTLARAKTLAVEPTLFGFEEKEAEVYRYATHFRRQLKARLLKDKVVTQIVRETTLTPHEFVKDNGMPLRRVEDAATLAWKLCTGAYYKSGGKPWQLADVRPGVCYVGLVYKRTELTTDAQHACCAAQMFLSDGDGVVFRGALGPWFQTDTKQFHLNRESARNLIAMVIREYQRLHEGKAPAELFIHAQASFSDEEWAGFLEATAGLAINLVGVQISDAREDLKLFRPGAYPVIRGTALKTGRRSALLWTTGYVARLDTYMGPETPNPIAVRVQRGDCALDTVLADILGQTKINFNSCLHNDRMPVTIRFANAVGDVLMSAPIDSEPRLPFKFYI